MGCDNDWMGCDNDWIDVVDAMVVAESVVDILTNDDGEFVDTKEFELMVLLSGPGMSMVVKAKSSPAREVVFVLVAQSHEDPVQQYVLLSQEVMTFPFVSSSMASISRE